MWSYRNAFWGLVLLILAGAVWRYTRVPGAAARAAKTSSKIVFVTGGPGAYWETTAEGAKAAAKDLAVDVEVKFPSKAEDLEEQMQILAMLNPSELSGIALSPLDADQQTRLINRLATETNVLTFDSDAPLSNRVGYVGASNYGAGRLCARLVHEAIPKGGKVVVLMANRTKGNLLDRKSGFDDHLNRLMPDEEIEKLSDFEVADYLVDEGDNDRCAELIRKALDDHTDIACFVGMNARHGPVLLNVLEEMEKLGEVKLVTFDYDEATLDGIEAGHIYATIAQDPYQYGYDAVRILASREQDGVSELPVVGRGSWNIPTEAVRKSNLADFRERVKARMGQAVAKEN